MRTSQIHVLARRRAGLSNSWKVGERERGNEGEREREGGGREGGGSG